MAVGVVLAGCGSSESAPPDGTAPVPERVRSFDGFALYSVGESFDGLPLTDVVRGSGRSWSFIYGDCTPPAGEGGCAPPLEIQNWSICDRFPALYGRSAHAAPSLEGARELPAGGGLDVYTGRTTVVIFGRDPHRALRSIRPLAATEDAPLPPPVAGALVGGLGCQRARLDRFER